LGTVARLQRSLRNSASYGREAGFRLVSDGQGLASTLIVKSRFHLMFEFRRI
jgi:hypothetical protein